MQEKQFTIINLIGPVVALLLLSATLMLPWVSFPALADLGFGWLLRIPSIWDTASTSSFSLDGSSAVVSVQEVVSSIKATDIIFLVLAVAVILLLLLSSFVLLVVAFIRGCISGAVKGIASSKVSIILLAVAQLCGILAILALNARMVSNVEAVLQSQGISQLPLAVVSPSLFLWGLFAGSVACFISLSIVAARFRKDAAVATLPAVTPVAQVATLPTVPPVAGHQPLPAVPPAAQQAAQQGIGSEAQPAAQPGTRPENPTDATLF